MSNIFKSIKVREIFSNMLCFYCLVSYHIVKFQTCCTVDSRVIATLKFCLLSKAIVTPKLLQLEYFPKICCSATLSLAIRWYIVWGSIACYK